MGTELQRTRVTVRGVGVDALEGGAGPTLLFLHGDNGPDSVSTEYLKLLGKSFRVLAPWHPGFGGSERPAAFSEMSDLVYFYLDLMRDAVAEDLVLVGSSFGGWLAAEIAIRSTEQISHLVLLDPLGIKAGARESRDIVDMFALTEDEWLQASFAYPDIAKRNFSGMSDEDIAAFVRGRESLARYGWSPYMHNPHLLRWLHRIDVPTLILRGRRGAVTSFDYQRAFADAIPRAGLIEIDDAGHFPQLEQPKEVASRICVFAGGAARARTSEFAGKKARA